MSVCKAIIAVTLNENECTRWLIFCSFFLFVCFVELFFVLLIVKLPMENKNTHLHKKENSNEFIEYLTNAARGKIKFIRECTEGKRGRDKWNKASDKWYENRKIYCRCTMHDARWSCVRVLWYVMCACADLSINKFHSHYKNSLFLFSFVGLIWLTLDASFYSIRSFVSILSGQIPIDFDAVAAIIIVFIRCVRYAVLRNEFLFVDKFSILNYAKNRK